MSLGSAFAAFFEILFDKDKAEAWNKVSQQQLTAEEETSVDSSQEAGASPVASNVDDAIYTLTLLQRGGRLIDFLQEDISNYADDQVGAAVRQIHKGCSETLKEYFSIEPIIDGTEGENLAIPMSYDPTEINLCGENIPQSPSKGDLLHKGWRVAFKNLPNRSTGHNKDIITPAQFENIS